MFQVVASRVLLAIAAVCFVAGFVAELQAQYQYCAQIYAQCGYHPCKCEDGSTVYGCSEALSGNLTGYCGSGSETCCDPNRTCGAKLVYQPPNTCSGCIGGVNQGAYCNKLHNCQCD
jgi:hypothetical protein